MKPKKTFRPNGSRIKLYSDRLEIEKFGCLSPKKTSYIPLQQIRKVHTRSGWLYVETTNETQKFHFETSNSNYNTSTETWETEQIDDVAAARRAAKEINKVIQENIDQQHPDYEYIPPRGRSCMSSFIGLVLLATVGLVILIGLGYIQVKDLRFPLPTATYASEVTYTGEIVFSGISIRATPSIESTILGSFSKGTTVTVLNCIPIEADDIPWIKVQGITDENGVQTGYMSSFSKYIETDCPK